MKRTILMLLLASGTAFAATEEQTTKTFPALSGGKPVVNVARALTATSSNGASRGPGVEFEMKVHRLSPRVATVIAGPWATKVIGIATANGIVVIDAPHSRTLAKQSRDALAREFGRTDFVCLILTHEHQCHAGGTEAYADLPILGHDSVYREMSRAMTDPAQKFSAAWQLAFAENEPERSRADLAKHDPKALESPRYKATLAEWGVVAADWRAGEKIVPPTITFDRAMTLHFGDVTLVLEYFGHAHSIGDTVVRIPEENVVATGGVFYPNEVPGFELGDDSTPATVDQWVVVLDHLLREANDDTRFLPSHHDAVLKKPAMRAYADYIANLWAEVRRARAAGRTLEQTKAALRLPDKFPALAKFRNTIRSDAEWANPDIHASNIEHLWKLLDRE